MSRLLSRRALGVIALVAAAVATAVGVLVVRAEGKPGSADAIPAITRPEFESPAVASRLLLPTDLVLGVDIHGDARAYPVKLLALHEAVDDEVGGRPIVVTWCPLCASGVVFDRRVAGRVLTFGITGRLYGVNQVLYDFQTQSLWSQLATAAIRGVLRGRKLRLVPASEQSWRAWRAAHPHTRVLSIRRDQFASDFVHPFSYVDFRGEESSDDPYLAYEQKISVYYGPRIEGVSGASRVVGLLLRGEAKAYPQELVQRVRVVNDRIRGVAVVIFWNGLASAPSVYSRRIGDRLLRFRSAHDAVVDTSTRSRWDPASGRAVRGRLAGKSLPAIAFTYPYWFAWHSFHPRTLVAHR